MGRAEVDAVTRLIAEYNAGEAGARDRLAAAVYPMIRRLAGRYFVRDFGPGGDPTLQPTAIADDTLVKLLGQRQRIDNAGQFFALASRLMLRIMVDHQREQAASKRGGGAVRIPLDPERDEAPPERGWVDALELRDLLQRLETIHPRQAEVARYRILFQYDLRGTAEALNVSEATVSRDWNGALQWFRSQVR